MGIESLIVFLIVGAIAGWLAGLIVKGYGFGLLGNIVVGIVGAFIAGWLCISRRWLPTSPPRHSSSSPPPAGFQPCGSMRFWVSLST